MTDVAVPDEPVYEVEQFVPGDLHGYDHEEALTFLDRIFQGWGEYEAGLAHPLCWTPLKIRKFMEVPGIRDLLFAIGEAKNETVENAVLKTARRGNPAAQKLWLLNKAAHRGWADRRTVKVEGEIDHNLVASVKQALDEKTRGLVQYSGTEGIAALQEAIGLGDAPEEDIIDAEVVDD